MHTNQQNTLVTVPGSLQEQIQRVQDLLDQSEGAALSGDYAIAREKAREGIRVLQIVAQSCPEIGALIHVGLMGYGGYEIEIEDRVDNHQLTDKKFLGRTIGKEVTNVPTVTRRTVRGRLL
jgi:hypothetical protein